MPIRNTDLTRDQFKKVTEQWIKDNPKKWADIRKSSKQPFTELQQIIEEKHGRAFWRDRPGRNKITGSMPTKDDPGVPFTIENKGKGKVGYKSGPTRKATRGQPTGTSSGTRKYLEHAASKPGTDFRDADRAMGEANAIGMDGGHITPLDRKVAGQEFKVQTGRSTVEEMNKQFDNAGIPYGHTRANIEPQPPLDNRVLQRQDYSVLDDHLKTLEKKSAVLADMIKSGRLKSARLAAIGLAAPSVLGTAASAAETGMRTQIAMQTKSLPDIVQALLSAVSLAGDYIPVAGEAVSTPADLANVFIDQHRAGGPQHIRGRSGAKRALNAS